MMREFKIFIIVAFIIGVIYYGVEPLAHHAMHSPAAQSDYEFKDLKELGVFGFLAFNVLSSCEFNVWQLVQLSAKSVLPFSALPLLKSITPNSFKSKNRSTSR